MDTYRDDLDAALLRAAQLERDNARLRARNREIEQRIRPTPITNDAMSDKRRLTAALQREREEQRARERARREDERLRALAKRKPAPIGPHDDACALVLACTFIGSIVAGAAGSLPGIGIVIGVAIALLFVIERSE